MRLSTVLPLLLTTLSTASPLPAATPGTAADPITELANQTPLNSFLTIFLDLVPDINGAIGDVMGGMTTFEQLLSTLTGESTTYNQLSGSCKPYTVLFARGTGEPGNVGILVGPPFFDALKAIVGASNLAIQGVNNYGATVAGYLAGGDSAGSAQMAVQIQQAKTQCPDTKLIVSGYSQGGQIVHNAIGKLSADVAGWISKVVVFGDPDSKKAIPNVASSAVSIICHDGDNICENGDLILMPHLTYAENAGSAAAFATS